MIKDKFNQKLKTRLRDMIDDTIEDGNERGVDLCLDKKGKLYVSNIVCTGIECEVTLTDPKKSCKEDMLVGNFHTHPYIPMYLEEFQEKFKRFPEDEELNDFAEQSVINVLKEKGIKDASVNTPSHIDLLSAIVEGCKHKGAGTVCTTSDVVPYETECWSPKVDLHKDIYNTDCKKAKR